jgi:uncharacterized protein YjbI with pentapeptide repeats
MNSSKIKDEISRGERMKQFSLLARKPMASDFPSPFNQVLAGLLLEAYRLERDSLFDEHKRSLDRNREGRYRDEGDRHTARLDLVAQNLNAAGVQLDLAYLINVDLNYAWLRQASLKKATLRNTHLFGANLDSTNMEGADLEVADLRWATFIEANFTGAKLEGALLSQAIADNTIFKEASLKKITMDEGRAIGADFTDADLSEATFIGVMFGTQENPRRANPETAKKLNGALFRKVTTLTENQISACTEKGAKFEDCIPWVPKE